MMKRYIGYYGLVVALVWLLPAAGAAAAATREHPAAKAPASATPDGLRLNFVNAPLDTVLDYLSQAAGFVIVREAEVEGTVSIMSHQPLSRDDAVDLLSTVLNQKGYAVMSRGRILTIVRRNAVTNSEIPVKVERDPAKIPRNDQLVTQVIPVQYADADNLVENLRPLLPPDTALGANHGSNSLIITAPQVDVKRMAEIVKALDTSLAAVSAVRVFTLQYADAKELASVITDLFKPDTTQNDGNRVEQFFRRMRGGPWGGGPEAGGGGDEENRAARGTARVIAVADERTNSLVVSAPEDLMSTIEGLVNEVDTATEDLTQIRVFPLRYADATELAQEITNIFQQQNQTTQTNQPQVRFFGGFGGRFGGRGGQNNQNNPANANAGRRTIQENTVLAIADVRTNSVVVRAASELMPQVEQMVRGLDEDPARVPTVQVYKLENADPEQVAAILQGVINGESSTSNSSTGNRNLRSQGSSTTRSNNTGGNNRNTSNRNTGNSGFSF